MSARWLLTLTIAGRVYRWCSSGPVTVDGELYAPGLGEISATADASSLGVTVDDEPPGGWAALAAAWPLEQAPAVLAWHVDGAAPVVIVDGYLSAPSWGPRGEALRGTVARAEISDGALMPDPTHVLDDTTWPSALFNRDEQRDGQFYPVIFGNPGYTPAVLAANPTLPEAVWVVADGPVAATEVLLLQAADVYQGETVPVEQARDQAGYAITIVNEADVTVITPVDNATTAEYYARWRGTEGGTKRPDRPGALRGLGEIVRYALQRWGTTPIDLPRWLQHEAWLDQYEVDTYIDEPTPVWSWCQDVLSMAPHRVRRSSAGVWIQPMRWDATDRDVVGELTQGRGIDRVGAVQSRGAPVNAFTLAFAPEFGKMRATRVLTAVAGQLRPGPAQPDDRVLGDARCAISQSRWGVRWSEPMEAPHTWSSTTALRMLRDRAAEQAIPHRTVRYVGGLDLARYEPGAVVRLVDDEVAINGVALVEEVTYSVDEVQLDLVALSSPRG